LKAHTVSHYLYYCVAESNPNTFGMVFVHPVWVCVGMPFPGLLAWNKCAQHFFFSWTGE